MRIPPQKTGVEIMEVTQAEQTAISAAMPPAERAALALNSTQTERDLLALATKHASIQVIKDKAGRDQAHGAAMEVKRARTTIERTGKEARDDDMAALDQSHMGTRIAAEPRNQNILDPGTCRIDENTGAFVPLFTRRQIA